MKSCNKCKTEKPLSEFYCRKNGSPLASCKECIREDVRKYINKNKDRRYAQQQQYRDANKDKIHDRNLRNYTAKPEYFAEYRDRWRSNNVFRHWFNASRMVKRRNKHEFLVTWVQMESILKAQNYACSLTKVPFYTSEPTKGVVGWDSPSIDRLDFSKGYTADNIRVVLFCVNSFRGRMTDTQMYDVAQKLIDNRE